MCQFIQHDKSSNFLGSAPQHVPSVNCRELKNKDTGIDLTIPTYKEIKGMLGSNYEYHVMVVSNLSYFKSAKHKKSDNVQFMVRFLFSQMMSCVRAECYK